MITVSYTTKWFELMIIIRWKRKHLIFIRSRVYYRKNISKRIMVKKTVNTRKAAVTACPETIKKVLAGKANPNDTDETGHQVFKHLDSTNVVISEETYKILTTPAAKRTLGTLFDEAKVDDGDDPIKENRAIRATKLKRIAKRQDGRADKITTSLKASDPIETVQCLRDIEKAFRQGSVTDYDSMFEKARDKGSDIIEGLVDTYHNEEKTALTWATFTTEVMKKLHGGENYLVTLRNSIDRIGFLQGSSTVGEYAEKHGPALKSILRAYEREGGTDLQLSGREKTGIAASFTDKWIKGLKSEVRGTLQRDHLAGLQKGDPMTFETAFNEALVNEQVSETARVRTAPSAAATFQVHKNGTNSPDRTDRRPKSPTITDMIGTVTEVLDKALMPSMAAMQAAASSLERFTSTNSPTTGQLQKEEPICFFCQRKGLDYKHSHVSCPARLENKRAREAGRPKPSFGHHQYSPGPPSTPPPPNNRNPIDVECYRCGGRGHRSYECPLPCKVCRKEGKGQHYPGCSNVPKPRSGNGREGRR
jgi:hypothetical protein